MCLCNVATLKCLLTIDKSKNTVGSTKFHFVDIFLCNNNESSANNNHDNKIEFLYTQNDRHVGIKLNCTTIDNVFYIKNAILIFYAVFFIQVVNLFPLLLVAAKNKQQKIISC